jgi:acylphosphatase
VLACGDAASLDQLGDWLREGPPHARVDDVSARDVERTPPGGFRTG